MVPRQKKDKMIDHRVGGIHVQSLSMFLAGVGIGIAATIAIIFAPTLWAHLPVVLLLAILAILKTLDLDAITTHSHFTTARRFAVLISLAINVLTHGPWTGAVLTLDVMMVLQALSRLAKDPWAVLANRWEVLKCWIVFYFTMRGKHPFSIVLMVCVVLLIGLMVALTLECLDHVTDLLNVDDEVVRQDRTDQGNESSDQDAEDFEYIEDGAEESDSFETFDTEHL